MTTPPRGGPGRGQGRRHLDHNPPGQGEYLQKKTIALSQELIDYFTRLGDGNMSAGVRRAGEEHKQMMENGQ